MEKCKKNLSIASIIMIIYGVVMSLITIKFSVFLWAIGGYLWWVSTKEEEEIKKNKTILFCIALLCILLNFLVSIFLFMAIDSLTGSPKAVNPTNGPPIVKKKKEIDPEVKKIDILLKLGVGMILISGILIATTSWNFISDIGKLLFLLFFAGVFLGLSIFTENKLKLYNTSFMYWILSMAFLLLIIVAILFFHIAGDYLCYNGAGKYLAYGITSLTLMGLSFATYLKFGKDDLLYIVYGSFYIALTFFLVHSLPSTIVCLVLSIIMIGVSYCSKKESFLFKWNKIASYILLAGLVFCNKTDYQSQFLVLSCITIGNHLYMASLSAKEDDKIPSLWIFHILMPIAISNCSFLKDYSYLIVFIIASIFAVIMKENKDSNYKDYYTQHFILYTIISIACIFLSGVDKLNGLLIASLYVAMNSFLELGDSYEESSYLEPVSIGLFIIALCSQSFINANYSQIFTIMSLTFIILHYVSQKEKKISYWIAIIVSIILSIITNVADKNVLLSILIFIPSIYLFFDTKQNQTSSVEKVLYSFFMVLITIYNFFYIVNPLDLTIILSSLLFIYILGTIIIITNDKILKKTCFLVIVVPLLKMIGEINDETIRTILISIIVLYIDFLIVQYFIENNNSKDTFGLIGIIIAILIVLPIENTLVGIYIGLIGLLTIMIGFSNNIYKSFFKGGIIITIVNIIYQLRDLWEQIPFSFYLLIGGLVIIGFVTIKEIKNKK